MKKDANYFLNDLPIWKLKLVAEEYRVDVSSCKYKRDYVEKIGAKRLTEEQVRTALKKAQTAAGEARPKDAAQEMKEIGKEIQSIAERPGAPEDVPSEDAKTLDRHLDEALSLKPSFFEVDSANENTLNKMLLGDYHEAIKANREARLKCLDQFSNFQVYSSAVSIRAAEELLAKLPSDNPEVNSGLKTSLAAAKMAFVHGTPRQREETIENLESLVAKAFETYWGSSIRAEEELLELIRDYESFGTRTEEARRYLEIAASASRSQNLEEHARLLGLAREAAERARSARAAELESVFHIVRAAAEEAEQSGASVPAAESGLAEARKAMDGGAFARAARLMADIERAADQAHIERLKADKDLERAKTEHVRALEAQYGPMIAEAASYGLDVREPSFYANNLRAAIDRNDIVNAVKFARRVRDIMAGMEKDLDQKRIEAGVAPAVPDAKCGKCGDKKLYSFPGSVQKCISCGHSFVVPPPQEPAPVIAPGTPEQAPPAQARPKRVLAKPQEQPVQTEEKKKRWLKW